MRPDEISVEQPTQFQLGLNLKVAKALAVSILDALPARADEGDRIRRGEFASDQSVSQKAVLVRFLPQTHQKNMFRYALTIFPYAAMATASRFVTEGCLQHLGHGAGSGGRGMTQQPEMRLRGPAVQAADVPVRVPRTTGPRDGPAGTRSQGKPAGSRPAAVDRRPTIRKERTVA